MDGMGIAEALVVEGVVCGTLVGEVRQPAAIETARATATENARIFMICALFAAFIL
jgi:hypothetical protein